MSGIELESRIKTLEAQNRALVAAVAVLAERWRRLEHETRTGEFPCEEPLGRFSFGAEGKEVPSRLELQACDNYIRIDFIHDSGES